MAVTIASIRSDFPQFEDETTTPDAVITSAITTSSYMVGATVWGDLADRAQSLIVAHLLTVRGQGESSSGKPTGNLTGISIPNEVSLQYSQAASSDQSGLSTTIYGQEFLALQKFVIVPIRIF